MKTAVEWLIEKFSNYDLEMISLFKDEINQAKEKEKEQIVDAYDRGYKACDLDEALEINKTMFNGEKYYIDNYKPETI